MNIKPHQKGSIAIADFTIADTGYYAMELKPNSVASLYPTIDGYVLTGNASESQINFVRNNDDNFFIGAGEVHLRIWDMNSQKINK